MGRWLEDGSAQWVHGDFLADVASRGKAVYRLRLSDEPMPRPRHALRVEVHGDGYRIDTGVVQFTVHRTGPFLETPALKGADLILKSDQRIYKAGQWQRTQLTVEESSPLKVVLKRTGAHGWADGQERALDYTLRIVAWAGQPSVADLQLRESPGQGDERLRPPRRALAGASSREAPPGWISSRPSRGGRVGSPPAVWDRSVVVAAPSQGFEVTRTTNAAGDLSRQCAPAEHLLGVAKTHEILLSPTAALRLRAAGAPRLRGRAATLVHARHRALGGSSNLLGGVPEGVLAADRENDDGYEARDRVRNQKSAIAAWPSRRAARRVRHARFRRCHPQGGRGSETRLISSALGDRVLRLSAHAVPALLRTGIDVTADGDRKAAAHLADVDIAHKDVRPGHDGSPRTSPGLNHWARLHDGAFFASLGW